MNNDWLVKKAQEAAERNLSERPKDFVRPRTISETAKLRTEQRELEKNAPTTGYIELDRIIKGFVPGHLYTLTGDTNVGKTSLACNFAERVRRQGRKVLYFALEPENTVVDYLASVRLNKPFSEITEADLDIVDDNLHIYGKGEVSKLSDLLDIVRGGPKYDLIIIDHIGYFITSAGNWLQEQSNAVKALAGLARERRVAIMQIAHLRKQGKLHKKNWTPTADDIAGSAAFKQDSTEVMIVTRTIVGDGDFARYSNKGKLRVVKTKMGPNGIIEVFFGDKSACIQSGFETGLAENMEVRDVSSMFEEAVGVISQRQQAFEL